jgi:hypothetical protein
MTQIKENLISGLAASSLVDVFAKLEELKATLAEMKTHVACGEPKYARVLVHVARKEVRHLAFRLAALERNLEMPSVQAYPPPPPSPSHLTPRTIKLVS